MIRRSSARLGLLLLVWSCGTTVDPIGYNREASLGGRGGETAESGAGGEIVAPTGGTVAMAGGAGAADAGGTDGGVAGAPVDEPGGDGGTGGTPAAPSLRPLTGPAAYPNPFRDVLGKTEVEISTKINEAFEQFFHGNPDTQAVYREEGDGAYIEDIYHADVRTEGMGLGMMICVQLDKREEFDRLWHYAKTTLRLATGPNAGYFISHCDIDGVTVQCLDPYGLQQMVMALVFAHGRWGSVSTVDYESDVLALFDVMRNKEAQNGGVVMGATNTFDAVTKLVFDFPHEDYATQTRPAVVMPAYYDLWAQATGDSFYTEAALAGRRFWTLIAHETTGLVPNRANFDGTPLEGWTTFSPEGYRTLYNVTLDRIWSGEAWPVDESNKVISFFSDIGINLYGREYTLDGDPVQVDREVSLVSTNGVVAISATVPERAAFVEAVWNLAFASQEYRYFSGTMQLWALVLLGGQFRVY